MEIMTDKFLMSYCITQFCHNVVAKIIRFDTTNNPYVTLTVCYGLGSEFWLMDIDMTGKPESACAYRECVKYQYQYSNEWRSCILIELSMLKTRLIVCWKDTRCKPWPSVSVTGIVQLTIRPIKLSYLEGTVIIHKTVRRRLSGNKGCFKHLRPMLSFFWGSQSGSHWSQREK